MATIQIWNLRHTIKCLISRVQDFHKTRRVQTGNKLVYLKVLKDGTEEGRDHLLQEAFHQLPRQSWAHPPLCLDSDPAFSSYSTRQDSLSTELAPQLDYEHPGRHTAHPLQYPCLESPTDRGVWRATVRSRAELGMTEETWHGWQELCLPGCVCAKSLSRVWPSVTPWTVAHQAPRSTGFSWQEY